MARARYLSREVQPDCCAASAIRYAVTSRDTWPYNFSGLSDEQSQRWLRYRDVSIKDWDRQAGRALLAKNNQSWKEWLTANWPRYREFCLGYAVLLDGHRRKTLKNAALSTESKEIIRHLFDQMEWAAEDAWYPDEQGWFPRRPFHDCADHLIDRHRICSRCRKPMTSLHNFVDKLLAVDRTQQDLDVGYAAGHVLADLEWGHEDTCPRKDKLLCRAVRSR